MEPLPPGRFSTTTDWGIKGRAASAMARAVLSLPPPGW